MSIGILGLGPPLQGNTGTQYPYVLDNMVGQGLINSRAFSLDLRDVDNPDGSIIFGGIDTGKYVGSLKKCPIIDMKDAPDDTNRYWIHLTTLGITLPSGESQKFGSGKLPVFLDSGGTLTRLPTKLFDNIGSAFPGAQYDEDAGLYTVNCSAANEAGSVDFGFSGKVISVPFADFIWGLGDGDDDECLLGVSAEDGESFLQRLLKHEL